MRVLIKMSYAHELSLVVVQVLKSSCPKTLYDFRPVALTLILNKICLSRAYLRRAIKNFYDFKIFMSLRHASSLVRSLVLSSFVHVQIEICEINST